MRLELIDDEFTGKTVYYETESGADRFYNIGKEIYFEHIEENMSDVLSVGTADSDEEASEYVFGLNESLNDPMYGPYSSIIFNESGPFDDSKRFIMRHGKLNEE